MKKTKQKKLLSHCVEDKTDKEFEEWLEHRLNLLKLYCKKHPLIKIINTPLDTPT